MFGILADSPTIAPIDISNVAGVLGSIGFAVWYAWYTTTKTIPDMQSSHRAERLEAQARYDASTQALLAELKAEREQYDASLKETRAQFSSDLRTALGRGRDLA